MNLVSDDFFTGDTLPEIHSLHHGNKNPALRWTDIPEGTVELALICDDPDAPGSTWIHWVLYRIPTSVDMLGQGVPKTVTLPDYGGAMQGTNDFGLIGYDGPSPPHGSNHRYFFRLYALSEPLNLKPNVTAAELRRVMEGKIIAEKEIIGMYSR